MKTGGAACIKALTSDLRPLSSVLKNFLDVRAELSEDDVVDRVVHELPAEALESRAGADAVVVGRRMLPDVRHRARRHVAREQGVVGLEAPVVAARDEDAAHGVLQTLAALLALRRLVARVLAEQRRVEAVGEEGLCAAGREVAGGARTPVGESVAGRLRRRLVVAPLGVG